MGIVTVQDAINGWTTRAAKAKASRDIAQNEIRQNLRSLISLLKNPETFELLSEPVCFSGTNTHGIFLRAEDHGLAFILIDDEMHYWLFKGPNPTSEDVGEVSFEYLALQYGDKKILEMIDQSVRLRENHISRLNEASLQWNQTLIRLSQ